MNKKELFHRICETLDKVNTKYDSLNSSVREVALVSIILLITTSNNLIGAIIGFLFISLRFIYFKGYWNEWSGELHEIEEAEVQDDISS